MELTVDQSLKQIHREYEGDINYPEFEDDETQLRVALLKDGLREWGNRFPQYRETFALLSDADDGDTETEAGVTIYDAPSNFVRPANFIKIGTKRLTYKEPQAMEAALAENAASEWFSITGSPGAYKIIINPEPGDVQTIDYPYWKSITQPSLTTDSLEISRPFFCVYYVLWKLFSEDDLDRSREYKELMDEEERLERVALARTSGLPNKMGQTGYGFGEKATSDENFHG